MFMLGYCKIRFGKLNLGCVKFDIIELDKVISSFDSVVFKLG